jgi:hypothetical protein
MARTGGRGLILSGYGDLTARSELPGLDFVDLDARLTKPPDRAQSPVEHPLEIWVE